MDYKEILKELNTFTQKLQDNESEKIFNMRIQYLINRDKEIFYQNLDEILQKKTGDYRCWRLIQYNERNIQNANKRIVVFGAGDYGKLTCRSLRYANKEIACLCDNNEALWGTMFQGIPIYSPAYMREHLGDSVIVIAVSERYQAEIYHQLINAGVRESDILIPLEGYMHCDRGYQYFDMEELQPELEGEYFVDAGSYNGMTSLQCNDWCKGNLKKVYAFEPGHKNYLKCKERLSQIGCEYELYECAVWSKETVLPFYYLENEGYASAVCKSGSIQINADSIDNKLNGRKATYMKYDVEGSELEALKGSVRTIQKYRPKLAISLYHKPEDVVEIPVFLEKLGLDYRYYLRHYQTRMDETVLYAI